ncbi:MAG: ABC transporter substrate-binding protein, partial [Thermomicrobiaceae bacterium]|nr:ABC transporter substrate-binding protein [Thermomicrobiaceae bacterium]
MKRGGTLTLGYNVQQLLQLDPARINIGRVAGELLPNLFSSLVQFDENLNVVPDLAEKWEVSNDGLVYTFHLRKGLKFHNGDPLTAQDFIYTFNRTKDPKLASPHANKLKGITKVDAPDDLTFVVTFSAPFAPFLATTCSRGPGRALTPVPKRVIDEIGNDEFLLKPVGCGPFKLVPETMDSQAGFTMEAWDEWYGGRPLLDKIVVKFIPEPASQVNALAAGDVDMLNEVPPQGVAQLEGNENVVVEKVHGTNWIAVQFNTTRPPFNNQDARMAVAKAIDRQKFIKNARFGLAEVSVGAI